MFRLFLRAYKIHSRTLKPMYWVSKNSSEFRRILRYINSRHFNFSITVYEPSYLDGFTVPYYDDDCFDEYYEDVE